MSDRRRPLAAVAALGARLGLPAGDLRVVSDRGNLLVHLAPAPVLARVATLTASTRRDPFAWLAREVTVAGHAARRGGPVASPTSLADPGPHVVDGLAISLWELREVLPGRPGAPELGQALAALHRATAGITGLPWLLPVTAQIGDALDFCARVGALPPGDVAALRERLHAVLADLHGAASAPVVLHGDAHAGNLLRSGGDEDWFWIDLEETCAGPPEWDLAVAAGDTDPAALLAAYAEATDLVVAPETLEPFRRARELEAAAWLAAMAHLRPARYRVPAAERLAAVLGPGLSGPARRAAGRSARPDPSRGSCS